MKRKSLAAITSLAAAAAIIGSPAQAATTSTTATTWEQAAAQLGFAGSLWQPTRTLGLRMSGPIDVVSDNLAIANSSVTAGDTAASAQYGTGKRGFTIMEKWANTGWAAEPPTSTERARVGTVRIPLGAPGTQRVVLASVSADCFAQPANADPTPIPRGFRCTKADVRRHGGTLTMTAVPPSTMTEPGRTSIVINSTGLTYAELVRIARGLVQISPIGNELSAGSAQMRALCEQMVAGKMTLAQAQALSTANGYGAVRAGTIDGQPQALTMDYRWDRFTVSLDKGAVTGCTYG